MHKVDPVYLAHQLRRWMRPDAHNFVRPDWRRFVRPGFEDGHPFALYEGKYSPEQLRVPAGNREGGQWTSEGGGGGDEIPTNARPAQFSPNKAGWHHYHAGPNLVCPADLQCSRQEIANQLARYSVPGQDSAKPVEDGKTYPVYEPITRVYVGSIKTKIDDDGLTITNRTLSGHIFYDGAVVRSARQADDGSWYVTTEGRGNNVKPGTRSINETVGPEIFTRLDQWLRGNIERHHAKGIVTALEIDDRGGRDCAGRFSNGGAEYAKP